jgi:ATP-dependent Lon protease
LANLSKDTSSTEYIKLKNWIDIFMKIPFNNYCSLPITINDGISQCKDYMINAKNILDNAVYGLNDAKMQLLQFIAQLINNPHANGLVLGIKGPMGTGKTTLIKDGISKILNRPFHFIPLAGIRDGTYFEGHSYTYEGSRHGKIVDILIQTKCMNPIIYGDELDKVSSTNLGDEIIGILTHLTDVTQSSQFNDKYFSELNFNLNKVIYIFSYNDENAISPILRDRMYKIETAGYNNEDKLVIAKSHLIPKIIKELNANFNIKLSDENIKFIINNYTDNEKGVRNLKRCLETIYNKLNLYNLVNDNKDFKDTFFKNFKYDDNVNENMIKILLSSFTGKTNNVPFGMYN